VSAPEPREPREPRELREPGEPREPREPREPVPRHRLDPEHAASLAGARGTRSPAPLAIDPRPYRWTIGIFVLVLVVSISIYQFTQHGVGTTGVAPGQRLRYFAAPLAASTLNGDANLQPPCTPARHDARALNLCLLGARMPVVLAFFVTGSSDCTRPVDALQSLALRFPASAVSFAAVAVHAGHARTAALVRSHNWTIPVAYDRDGSVGSLYGVVICPMIELAYRGGIVKDRLIGARWATAAAIGPFVRSLLRSERRARATGAVGGA
jgi:peroxiredoxin